VGRHLRKTEQRGRLPYWTPFMPEADDAAVLARSMIDERRRVRDAVTSYYASFPDIRGGEALLSGSQPGFVVAVRTRAQVSD
jgi:hypothetical protein